MCEPAKTTISDAVGEMLSGMAEFAVWAARGTTRLVYRRTDDELIERHAWVLMWRVPLELLMAAATVYAFGPWGAIGIFVGAAALSVIVARLCRAELGRRGMVPDEEIIETVEPEVEFDERGRPRLKAVS
jgi:hypothetical protein